MLVNRLPHAENSWQPLEKFSRRLITFPLPEASGWSWPLRSMTNTVNIRTRSQDSETLSHAPVKAWPTNTPGGVLIFCNVGTSSQEFGKGNGGGMKTAKDECIWSSPKGTLPWPGGTDVRDCSCQCLLGFPALLMAQDHISVQTAHPTLNPAPGRCLIPGLGFPVATPQLPCPCWGSGLEHSWQTPALQPFVHRKLLGWLPRLHLLFPDLRTQCSLVSSQIVPSCFLKMGSRQNKCSYFWKESKCCYLLLVVMILHVLTLLSRWISKHFVNVAASV